MNKSSVKCLDCLGKGSIDGVVCKPCRGHGLLSLRFPREKQVHIEQLEKRGRAPGGGSTGNTLRRRSLTGRTGSGRKGNGVA